MPLGVVCIMPALKKMPGFSISDAAAVPRFHMKKLTHWSMVVGAIAAATVVAYLWLDQPFAYWTHDHLSKYAIFGWITLLTAPLPPIAVATIVTLGVRSFMRRPAARIFDVALICSVSLIIARSAKDQLKFVFGRTWPETWVNDNPSLIRDGVFGFNPFHGGAGFESFPSGHTTAMCAVMTVLWVYYPRYRYVYMLLIAVISIGLLGANYHFISDMLAGYFLGTSIAIVCVSLFGGKRQL
jgi:membrane-associated phospholipid phosphatase